MRAIDLLMFIFIFNAVLTGLVGMGIFGYGREGESLIFTGDWVFAQLMIFAGSLGVAGFFGIVTAATVTFCVGIFIGFSGTLMFSNTILRIPSMPLWLSGVLIAMMAFVMFIAIIQMGTHGWDGAK